MLVFVVNIEINVSRTCILNLLYSDHESEFFNKIEVLSKTQGALFDQS